MRTLLYYIAFGLPDLNDAKLSIESARRSNFDGDIVVVSDTDHKIPNCRVINVQRNPKVWPRLQTKNETLLWQRRGGKPKINYLITRKIPHDILNTKVYDRIIFSDTDILFHGDMHRCLPHDNSVIWGQRDNSSMLENILRLGPLSHYDQGQIPHRPGLCTGLWILPKRWYGFSKQWFDLYTKFTSVKGKRQHQASFNLALHKFKTPFVYLNGVGAQGYVSSNWVTHFWVEHRPKMRETFTKLYKD